MKEIIFRGKTESGKWIEGGFHKHTKVNHCPLGALDGDNENTVCLILRDGLADWELPVPIEGAEVRSETVGQWTGLLDHKGNKIFEGDIVRINSCTELAYVSMEEFQWVCVMPALQNWRHRLEGNFSKYEVVGNIWDSPELLKER